jgi:gliding motility-associated-like protein
MILTNYFGNYLKFLLLIISFGAIPESLFSQIFTNPGLEGTPAQNTSPTNWSICGGTPDLHNYPSGPIYQPTQGNNLVGLVKIFPGLNERIGQQLPNRLDSTSCYSFDIDLQNYNAGLFNTTNGYFVVWLSNKPCGQTFQAYKSPLITHNSWKTYTINFIPDSNYQYVTFDLHRPANNLGDVGMFLDNIDNEIVSNLSLVDLGPDTTLCIGDTLTFDFSKTNLDFVWQDNSTDSIYDVVQSGKYKVTISTSGNCQKVDSITVTFPEKLNLGNDTTICSVDSILLNATTANGVYQWSTGQSTPTIYTGDSGFYQVTVSAGNCTQTDSRQVGFFPSPSFSLGNDTVLCAPATLTLRSGIAGATYRWQDNSMADTFLVDQAGTYYLALTLNGCTYYDTILVDYLNLKSVNSGPDQTICAGDSINLSVPFSSPPTSIQWHRKGSNQVLSTSNSIQISTPDTFWVEVRLGVCVGTDTIIINQLDPIPPVDLGEDVVLCYGESLLLNATVSGATYMWQDNSTQATFTVTQAGTYSVTVSLNGCTKSDEVKVGYNPLQPINLGKDTTLCEGEVLPLQLTVPQFDSLRWSNGSSALSLTISQAGKYWVSVYLDSCLVSDTIQVFYTPPIPIIDLGPDIALCNEDSLLLDATVSGPPVTYTWQDNSTSSTYLVKNPGTYSVTVARGRCIKTDQITITYDQLPPVELGPDRAICSNEDFYLNVPFTAGAIYQWQDGSTQSRYKVNNAGKHWVTVTKGACSFSDTVSITYKAVLPEIDFGEDTILCSDQSWLLDATVNGATYTWHDNTSTPTYLVQQSGFYAVTVTLNGCTETADVNVKYNNLQAVDIGNDTSICPNDSLLLEVFADPNTIIRWNNGNTGKQIFAKPGGKYYVDIRQGGCEFSDTINIGSTGSVPTIELGNDTLLCPAASYTINAISNATQFQWSTGTTTQSILIEQAGTYTVTVANNTCDAIDSVKIQYITPPSLGINDTTICKDDLLILDGSTPAANYLWQDGSTSAAYLVTTTGTYQLQWIFPACTFASEEVTVNEEDCTCQLALPNVFSPNGDGLNDEWVIEGKCELLKYVLTIYNRYNEVVFQSYSPKHSWDGRSDGKEVSEGVYFYVMRYQFSSQELKKKSGSVFLVR